jgi:hypothetical protein
MPPGILAITACGIVGYHTTCRRQPGNFVWQGKLCERLNIIVIK